VNVVTGETEVLSAALPSQREGLNAVWDPVDQVAYIAGGAECDRRSPDQGCVYHDEILRFDPATETVTLLSASLGIGREDFGMAWDGHGSAFVMGGCQCTADATVVSPTDTVRISRPSAPPTGLQATPGNEDGRIDLSWSPPNPATYRSLDAYHVYRDGPGAGGFELVASVPGTQTSYADRDLPSGQYTYYVEAVRAADSLVSPPSNQASADAPQIQDDAGSGGDASDDPDEPTPMPADTGEEFDFKGTLIPVQDTLDAYGVQVDAGETEVLNFTITPPPGYDIRLELRDPAGTSVDTSDQGGIGRVEHVEVGTSGTHLDEGVWVLIIELVPASSTTNVGLAFGGDLFDYSGKRRCHPEC
ncbi:MAG: fibronectin type III domain-containing protein, partial [Candidatus Thermoplasmatota archaeon]|nr:fibronectin type III domain-containing protein [Candidatus Thermoplasmatota archaeon]